MGYNPFSNQMFSSATDIRGQAGTDGVVVNLSGLTTGGDGFGGNFVWDATSTLPDDGKDVFQVTNVTTGRWLRLKNQNVIKGNSTFSGVSLVNTFTVNHGLSFTPIMVIISPTSLAASGLNWISSKTSTSFSVTFITAPTVGTNNITFDWVAIKQ